MPTSTNRGLAKSSPFLLTMPAYAGTLAAARCLGEHGVSVTMAGEKALAPARWSRYVTRWVKCPPVEDTEAFYDWLLEFGRREPGHVLYPTCDDLAWLLSDRAEQLAASYHLYQPKVDTIVRLLDKKALHLLCEHLGIDTVPTAFPANQDEALQGASDIGYPLLLKPRTQILLGTRSKGNLVERADDLACAYSHFVTTNRYRPPVLETIPGVHAPMLQSFSPDACESIYSIAAFIGRSDGRVVARASRKILQRPRKLGIGLCFEEVAVDAATLDSMVRLCREVGYFGVFEAEFLQDGASFRIIDFNPRFYGQMGFEVARGLPLAHLVWLGALGANDEQSRTITEAQSWREGRGYGYCDRFFLELVLSLQRMSGAMTASDVARWRRWKRAHQRDQLMIDATDWPGDRLPWVVSALRELTWASFHPRSFLRKTILDIT